MGRGNVQANYHGVVGACLILTQYIHVQKVPLKRGWTRQALKTCSLVRFSSALRRSRRSDVTAGPHQWRLLQCHRPTSKSFRYSDSRLKKESHDEKLRPKKKNATDSLLAITPFSESDLPDGADSVARVDCVVALIAN